MKALRSYIKGIGLVFRKWKLWVLLYLFNILFATLIGFPLVQFLQSKVVASPLTDQLFEQFNFTLIYDFFNQYGSGFSVLYAVFILVSLFYLLLSVFFAGGIVTTMRDRDQRFLLSDFWAACSHWFWRMFRLMLYFWLVQIILLVLFIILGGFILGPWDEMQNAEVELTDLIRMLFPVYAIMSLFVYVIQDYAKIALVRKERSWVTAPFWNAFGFCLRRFGSVALLAILNLLGFATLVAGQWYIQSLLKSDEMTGMIIAFAVGQAFLMARLGCKLSHLGGGSVLWNLYHPLNKNQEE